MDMLSTKLVQNSIVLTRALLMILQLFQIEKLS